MEPPEIPGPFDILLYYSSSSDSCSDSNSDSHTIDIATTGKIACALKLELSSDATSPTGETNQTTTTLARSESTNAVSASGTNETTPTLDSSESIVLLTPFHLLLNYHWKNKIANRIRNKPNITLPPHVRREELIMDDTEIVLLNICDGKYLVVLGESINGKYMVLEKSNEKYEVLKEPEELEKYVFHKDLNETERLESTVWYLKELNRFLRKKQISGSIFAEKTDFNECIEMKLKSFKYALPRSEESRDGKYSFDAVLIEVTKETLTSEAKKALQYAVSGYTDCYRISEVKTFTTYMVDEIKRLPDTEKIGRWIVKGGPTRPLDPEIPGRFQHAVLEEYNGTEYMQISIQHKNSLTNKGDSGFGVFIIEKLANSSTPGRMSIIAMVTSAERYSGGEAHVQLISRIISQFKLVYRGKIADLTLLSDADPTSPSGETSPPSSSCGTSSLPSSGGTSPPSPSGGTSSLSPSGGTSPPSSSGGTSSLPPSGGTSPTAPSGGTFPPSSSGGTSPPSGEVPIMDQSETSD